MFRALVIAATLTGMHLCQHSCMTKCGPAPSVDGPAAVAACPCCQHRQDRSNDDRPSRPCGDDGECDCQGVCGGAVVGEAFVIDGLLLAWAAQAAPTDAPFEATSVPSPRCRRSDDGKIAADGRALRILIASLQT